jgi:hypothetical protein
MGLPFLMTSRSFRVLISAGVGGVTANTLYRYFDSVKGKDGFSEYLNKQHQKHFLSGMHEPYIPNNSDPHRAVFENHFSKYNALMPVSHEEYQARKTITASVVIKPLSALKHHPSFPHSHNTTSLTPDAAGGTLVVGGPPGLISSAQMSSITYINDKKQIGIYVGSAHHLEHDTPSESPTSLQPVSFMCTQLYHLLFPSKLSNIEETGFTPWSTLDWRGWIMHPSMWIEGLRLAVAFQRSTMASQAEERERISKVCTERCRANEQFYEQLNRDIIQQQGGDQAAGLFMPGVLGSLIVARDDGMYETAI